MGVGFFGRDFPPPGAGPVWFLILVRGLCTIKNHRHPRGAPVFCDAEVFTGDTPFGTQGLLPTRPQGGKGKGDVDVEEGERANRGVEVMRGARSDELIRSLVKKPDWVEVFFPSLSSQSSSPHADPLREKRQPHEIGAGGTRDGGENVVRVVFTICSLIPGSGAGPFHRLGVVRSFGRHPASIHGGRGSDEESDLLNPFPFRVVICRGPKHGDLETLIPFLPSNGGVEGPRGFLWADGVSVR
ncbi:hypothetical protein GWK47_016573 [Chionoecetes opilio]|uniref:Uncharacterized protein n=1 Tax=Chionoecetes opilio TaxID=41210 RepID=A0A8J4Y0X1_CHIOP|nr:hypothetical protein GWK47_016573 [Chionoecetes opilio]